MAEQFATGYVPRDYASFPLGSSSYARKWDEEAMPLLSMQEAAERCREDAEKGLDPLGHAIRAKAMPTYQNGFGYCWSHAATMGLKIAFAQSGQPVPQLSATAMACLVKNYRDQGGNAFEAFPHMAQVGLPTVDHWPENSRSRSNDTEEMRENAKLHRIIEWWELPDNSDQHKWTALAYRYSLWSGYMNIGHAMLSARFTVENGQPCSWDINSWNKNAPDAGDWSEGWYRDQKTIYKRKGRDFRCFECYAVRVATVAA